MYFMKLSQVDQYLSETLHASSAPEVTECLKYIQSIIMQDEPGKSIAPSKVVHGGDVEME
jgi:hypothetical protein